MIESERTIVFGARGTQEGRMDEFSIQSGPRINVATINTECQFEN